MKYLKSILFFTAILIFTPSSFAQDNEITKSIDSIESKENKVSKDSLLLRKGGLTNQFDFLIKKSSSFVGLNGLQYKAVKLKTLNVLKANTVDSLRTMRKELLSLKNKVELKSKEINRLKSHIKNSELELEDAIIQRDSILIFNLPINKSTFTISMTAIIVVLIVLLLVFLYKFKQNYEITKTAKQNLADLEIEFEEHRKNALEREQKVRRQLIDEINKHKKGK